jgi:BON domain
MKFFPNHSDSIIRTLGILVGGLGLGAALMYVLDPERGKRRRALVRDKALSGAHEAGERIAARSRDLSNRARGVAANLESRKKSLEPYDRVLEERVRAEMGRAVARPSSVEVTADAGRIWLTGAVQTGEVDDLLSTVRGVPGVKDVENRLEVYETAEEVTSRAAALGVDRWEPVEVDG